MKRFFIILLGIMSFTGAIAQDVKLSADVQAVYDAFMSMREAVAAGSTTGLKAANVALKKINLVTFSSLRPKGEELSLNGHFVFDERFVDSLIAGRSVYKFAQRYAEPQGVRGAASGAAVYAKNCAVKGKESAKYTFVSRGLQELVVITEPGGNVSLRIHDMTNDTWYNDTKSVKKGKPVRTAVFNLPEDKRNILEVEVINCGKQDVSFVIMSNGSKKKK